MGRVFKYLLYLVLIGILGLVGYALVSDLPPPADRVVVPVTPDLN